MCVIIACPSRLPSLDILKACENNNKDGGGIAYPKDGMIYYEKGLTAKEIDKQLTKLKNVRPVVIHFRIATVGGKSTALCHPFPIEVQATANKRGMAEAVLFHNGHWTKWKETLSTAFLGKGVRVPKGEWSDSRAMAWLLGNYGREMMNFIDLYRDRVAILGKNKKVQLFGDFDLKDDIYYSNTYWYRESTVVPLGSGFHSDPYKGYGGPNRRWNQKEYKWEDIPIDAECKEVSSKKDECQSSAVPLLMKDDKEYAKAVDAELEKSATGNSDTLTGGTTCSQTIDEKIDEVLAEQKKSQKIFDRGRIVTDKSPGVIPCYSPDSERRFYCTHCTSVFKPNTTCSCGNRLVVQ